jgi:hypothetical protein
MKNKDTKYLNTIHLTALRLALQKKRLSVNEYTSTVE